MNRYGQQAMAHWRRHRSTELATIDDPTTFFTDLGETVQSAVTSMRDEILAREPTTNPVEVRRRARQATATAEEIVLGDLVLLPAEPTTSPADPILEDYFRRLAEANEALADPT